MGITRIAAASALLATLVACAVLEPDQYRVTRQAVQGVYDEAARRESRVNSALKESWELKQTSTEDLTRLMEGHFGRRAAKGTGGSIYGLTFSRKSVQIEMIIESGGGDSGFNAAHAHAVGCLRFTGEPGPAPAARVEDTTCPRNVLGTRVLIVKVMKRCVVSLRSAPAGTVAPCASPAGG
jgi:hypothetical protein